ncbi:hypothetical protein [Corynebacterium ulcerans]|uniref:hypothetical protein n=1 Tax=Corynebacterium ulcerans TaxID=65058 RepID=UPI0002141C72|nr:hypothetical protein [Corynebacterium ulcerans]AEG81712.1 hypothetical protein CULC809_01179 [Corynebacterium ulcerans 809]AEG83902.1 hypothetical protein CULC22_01192 [Corynebacterium ulcerans BR-AD22]PLW03623.1 hypothetical protein BRL54_00050 [Corynebacterium ulcerans]
MANPAELLLRQFLDWSPPNKDREDSRALRTDPHAWEKHLRAARLLTDIKEMLTYTAEQGYDVSVYEGAYQSWVKMLWNYPGHWQASGHGFGSTEMNYLRTASSLFSAVLPEFAEEKQPEFKNFLMVLTRRIEALDGKHKHLKAHALRVVRHVQGCLDELDIYGEFRVFSAIEDLQRLLDVLAEEAGDSTGFFHKAKNGMWAFFKKNTALLAISSVAIAGQAAIESASQDLYELVKNDIKAITTNEEQTSTEANHDKADTQPLKSHQ